MSGDLISMRIATSRYGLEEKCGDGSGAEMIEVSRRY